MGRISIPYFDGVNSFVEQNVAKSTELRYAFNARSTKIGSIEKRKGFQRIGNAPSFVSGYGLAYFNSTNASSKNLFYVSKIGSTTAIRYLNTSDVWTALSGSGTGLSEAECSFAVAEGKMFMVNGTDANREIATNGTTVTTSSSTSGSLYQSPISKKINYYKDRLYLADYTVGSTRYQNGVMFSSSPVGLVSLVDGDHASSSTSIKVTDTKYINPTDSIDVYRGGTLITTLTVSAKQEYSITVSSTSVALLSSDELWVANTYTGSRIFRWASNPASGVNAKEYDTFKLTCGNGERIKMMVNVGDVMVLGNNNSIASWNDYNLTNFDVGVGCVSDNGYVLTKNTLFFVHYTGVYMSTGGVPKLISSKVEEFFTGASVAGLEASVAGAKGFSTFFYIGDVTLYNDDGSVYKTVSDVVLEYNIRQDNWFVHTGIPVKRFAKWVSSTSGDNLAFQYDDTETNVFEFLSTTTDKDKTGASNIEIPWEVTTSNINLQSNFEKYSYLKKVIVELESGMNVQVFISPDDSPFYQIQGSAKTGTSTLLTTPRSELIDNVRCQQVRVSFREISDRACKITRIALVYDETEEEDMNVAYQN